MAREFIDQPSKFPHQCNHYFVAVTPRDLTVLQECGVKNVLVSYAFIDKFGGTLAEAREKFDKVFVDSGAFTAFSLGWEIDEYEYYDWLKKEKENYTVASQLDVIHYPDKSIKRYLNAIKYGIDWILPIAQPYSNDDWHRTIIRLEREANMIEGDYIGIGGWAYGEFEKRGLENVIKYLPRKYRYHGFAKVNFHLMEHGFFYSVDSSSWSTGIRFGTISAWWNNKSSETINVGRAGKGDRLMLRKAFQLHKEDAEACGVTYDQVVAGDRVAMSKAYVALYSRPRLRSIGIFDQNFKW